MTRSPNSTGDVPGPEPGLRHAAERDLPLRRAVDVERVDAARLEIRVHLLAVGRHRRRGVGVLPVPIVVHRPVVGGALPRDAAGLRVDGEHLERVRVVDVDGVGVDVAGLQVVAEVDRRLAAGDLFTLDRRRQEDAIAPDDRRRMAASRNLGLPLDVRVGRPRLRQPADVEVECQGRPARAIAAIRRLSRARATEASTTAQTTSANTGITGKRTGKTDDASGA